MNPFLQVASKKAKTLEKTLGQLQKETATQSQIEYFGIDDDRSEVDSEIEKIEVCQFHHSEEAYTIYSSPSFVASTTSLLSQI